MDKVIDFLLNNYIWIVVIALIIIFALIGYLVDSASNPKKKEAVKPLVKETNQEFSVHPSVAAYTNEEFDEPLISDKNVSNK